MNESLVNSDSPTKGNILLVDDLPENLKLLTELLSELGYTVRSAISGSRALKTVKLKHPDIILLDIAMPEMDGYEVCQAFKADPDLCKIPILFISVLDDTFDKLKAFQSGGVDYITKPFQIEEVVARLETHLTIQKQQRILQVEIAKRQQTELALEEKNRQLQDANHKLELLANLDGLTQISNRRRFDQYLAVEWQRHHREQHPLALILIDIDYFKRYNDTLGHPAGDRCLYQVAQAIASCLKRPEDFVARYGGEEFVVVLPYTPLPGAVQMAQQIQAALQRLALSHPAVSDPGMVTMSIGIVCGLVSEQTAASLMQQADQALYEAKRQGRNRYVVATNE